MKAPDTVTLEAVGAVLARELDAVVGRILVLEQRPSPVDGEPGLDGEPGRAGVDGAPGKDGANGERGEPGELGETGASGKDGAAGRDGADGASGRDGEPGIGLNSPAWRAGVYRAGVIVQHHIGQHFRARVDTASEPPNATDWERMGAGGFRLTGGYAEGRQYLDGDLFVRDFGLFLWHAGEAHLWAGRGGRGEPGQRGAAGEPGKPGRDGLDGAVIEAAELRGTTLVFVQRRPDGRMTDYAVDLMPFVESSLWALKQSMEQQFKAMQENLEANLQTALEQIAHKPARAMHANGAR